jgi:hypothetical protein
MFPQYVTRTSGFPSAVKEKPGTKMTRFPMLPSSGDFPGSGALKTGFGNDTTGGKGSDTSVLPPG